MVYFEDMSVREAGRKLGWQKSAANRHHGAAMEKMVSLVGDRSLLSPASLGIAAWVVSKGEGHRPWLVPVNAAAEVASEGVAFGAEAASFGAHRLGALGRRLAPFSDAGSVAATGSGSGAGRVLGACAGGLVVVVCGLGATGVVGPGVSSVDAERPRATKSRAAKPARVERAPVARKAASPSATRETAVEAQGSSASAGQTRQRDQREPEPTFPPVGTGRGVTSEFGIDGEASETEPAPAPESQGGEASSPSSSPTPAPAPRESGDPAAREVGL